MDKLYTPKELRQMTGLSQQKFANFTHIPVATIQQWEQKIDEIEDFLGKMHFGRMTRKEWERIQEIVAERQFQRYITCLNSGMDERIAAGAFDD